MNNLHYRALDMLPCTIMDISEALRINRMSARYLVQTLKRNKLAHVSGWLPKMGMPQQIWDKGDKEDAKRPVNELRSRIGNWATAETATIILCHLENGPLSVKEAAYYADVTENNARKLLKAMHKDKVIHLCEWKTAVGRGGGHPTMYFALGKKKDAKYPERQNKRDNWNRWAESKRKKYGNEYASLMIRSRGNGGADTIVIDGKTVYQRKSA